MAHFVELDAVLSPCNVGCGRQSCSRILLVVYMHLVSRVQASCKSFTRISYVVYTHRVHYEISAEQCK